MPFNRSLPIRSAKSLSALFRDNIDALEHEAAETVAEAAQNSESAARSTKFLEWRRYRRAQMDVLVDLRMLLESFTAETSSMEPTPTFRQAAGGELPVEPGLYWAWIGKYKKLGLASVDGKAPFFRVRLVKYPSFLVENITSPFDLNYIRFGPRIPDPAQ